MKAIILLLLAAAIAGCSTTTIEHAIIEEATFNSANWKSQAGVGANATIEATTSPRTDAGLNGL